MPNYYVVAEGDKDRRYGVESLDDGRYRVELPSGETVVVDAYAPEPGRLHLLTGDGQAHDLDVRHADGAFTVQRRDQQARLEVLNERQKRMRVAGVGARGAGGPELISPMAGKVVALPVAEGDLVEEGQTVIIVEAMKMENDLKAHKAGTIASIPVAAGQAVEIGDVLVVIDGD